MARSVRAGMVVVNVGLTVDEARVILHVLDNPNGLPIGGVSSYLAVVGAHQAVSQGLQRAAEAEQAAAVAAPAPVEKDGHEHEPESESGRNGNGGGTKRRARVAGVPAQAKAAPAGARAEAPAAEPAVAASPPT